MAEAENFGAKFSIDIDDLKAGLKTANKLIRESESEFKAAAAGLDDWTQSEQGLIAKKKQLTKTLEVQNEVLEAYQKQMLEAGYAEDDMSDAAIELRTKINNQKAAIEKTKKSIEQMDSALDELGNEADDAGEELEDVGDSAKKSGDGFTIAKGAIADLIAKGLTALVGACKNAITSIANLAEETREYREDMGKLETAWESAGKSTEDATKIYKEFYSVLGEEDRSVEAVNHLAKFVDTEEDLAKWTDICTGVWGTFGDSLPIEGLTEASNETAKVGKLTGVLADALNWAGVNEEDFQAKLDGCSTEQERQKLITETLNGLYSEAADNYRENNEQIINARKATSDYTDTMAALGEKIEPITTKVREGFNKILTKVLELTEDVDIDGFGKKIDDAFEKFSNDYLPKILDGLQWIKDNGQQIAGTITGIGTAMAVMFVANKIKAAVDAWKAYKLATEGATVAQWALNVAQNANPIGLIVAAIAGLVAAFIYLWKNCDEFREFWINLWEKIKDASKAVAEWFKETWSKVSEWFVETWGNVSEFFSDLWADIKNIIKSVGDWFEKTWSSITEWFKKTWTSIKDFFKKTWNGIKDSAEKVSNWFTDTWTSIKDFFADVFESIKEKASEAWNAIKNVFKTAYNWIKTNVFDRIKNSALVKIIGELAEGCWILVKTVWGVVATWFTENVLEPVKKFFSETWSAISEKASEAWNFISDKVSEAWQKIKDVFSTVSAWFSENVLEPVKKFFSETWNAIKTKASEAWEGIKAIWNAVSNWFTDKLALVKDAFVQAFRFAKEKASEAWEGIKSVYSAVSTWFSEKVTQPIKNFFSETWDKVKGGASEAWEKIKNVFGGVADWFKDKFSTAWQKVKDVFSTGGEVFGGIVEGIEKAFKKVVNAIIRGINKTIAIPFNAINNTLDKIRDVSIAGVQPFAGLITRFNVPEIPELAKGGVVRSATNAIIGEDGDEAVLPLEKNTGWMDKLADKIASKNKSVVVNQTNNYSQAHSRFEIYKSKKQTAAAVRLALQEV